MVDNAAAEPSAVWLPVIGKSLAYLCLQDALSKNPEKYNTVLKQVTFLEGLGLPRNDAAAAVGSTAESVRVMQTQQKRKKSGAKK